MQQSKQPNTGGLILQQKWEDMASYIYKSVLRVMPKSERFTLGSDIRQIIWDTEGLIVEVSLNRGSRTLNSVLSSFILIKHPAR